MKHTWLIFIQISFLLGQSYDGETIWFYQKNIPGMKLKGKLISLKLNQELNAETGFTSEVVFKPDDKKQVPLLFAGGTKNNGEHYIFDVKDIYNITNTTSIEIPMRTYGITLYSKELQINYLNRKEIDERINLFINDRVQRRELRSKSHQKFIDTISYGGCAFILFIYFFPDQVFQGL